jgi:hypothetical protein
VRYQAPLMPVSYLPHRQKNCRALHNLTSAWFYISAHLAYDWSTVNCDSMRLGFVSDQIGVETEIIESTSVTTGRTAGPLIVTPHSSEMSLDARFMFDDPT